MAETRSTSQLGRIPLTPSRVAAPARVSRLTPRDASALEAPRTTGLARTSERRNQDTARLASLVMRGALTLIAAISMGNLNPIFIGGEGSNQQVVAIAAWLMAIVAALFVPPRRHMRSWVDMAEVVVLYGFAILSVAWGNYSPQSALKGIALLITTVGAYYYATRLNIREIIECVVWGLLATMVASLVTVTLFPDIGILKTWMHNGQWAGVFESKQTLGTGSAFLLFFAWQRARDPEMRWFYVLAVLITIPCLIGSGSRGGGAVAVAAIIVSYLAARFHVVARMLAAFPVLMIGLGLVLIAMMVASYVPYFLIGGEEINLTERTFIWHYALSHLRDHAILGYGLNGFWSDDQILYMFKREHGWVLDNFHNGYIAVIMETGIVGYTLLAVCHALNGRRLVWLNEQQGYSMHELLMTLSFLNLTFLINFTETFFLRSTNIVSTLLAVVLFYFAAVPIGAATASPSPNASARNAKRIRV